jgi:hypothetical protein
MNGSARIVPRSTSSAASRYAPNESVSSDELKRSVTNAIVRPSGDHAGCRSAYASSVRRRSVSPSRSNSYKSLTPPRMALNAIRRPSGDHVGEKI